MDDDRPRPFAAVLNELCSQASAPDGGRYSNVALARAIGERGGKVTNSYIAQLRRGIRDNPTLRQVAQFADVLGVHPAYFVGGRRDPAHPTGARRSFQDRLNFLFGNVPRPDRAGEYGHEAVATAVRARGRELRDPQWTISPNTVAELRHGENPNPTWRHLLALADFFQVKPAYFLDDELAAQVDEQITQYKLLHRLGLTSVATRAAQTAEALSPDARASLVRALVDALRPIGVTPRTAMRALATELDADQNSADQNSIDDKDS
jgi:transcriptional regulator with XRE-family HTH domain